MHRLCEPGGLLLHLTCLPIPDRMEVGGRVLGQLDQAAFVEGVVVIERAVDLLVEEGVLIDEARLEHQVLAHFSSGPEAIEHFDASTKSEVTGDLRVRLARIDRRASSGQTVFCGGCAWYRGNVPAWTRVSRARQCS